MPIISTYFSAFTKLERRVTVLEIFPDGQQSFVLISENNSFLKERQIRSYEFSCLSCIFAISFPSSEVPQFKSYKFWPTMSKFWSTIIKICFLKACILSPSFNAFAKIRICRCFEAIFRSSRSKCRPNNEKVWYCRFDDNNLEFLKLMMRLFERVYFEPIIERLCKNQNQPQILWYFQEVKVQVFFK